MDSWNEEEIEKRRVCSHLIEPPAGEVINECLDQLEQAIERAEMAESENKSRRETDITVTDVLKEALDRAEKAEKEIEKRDRALKIAARSTADCFDGYGNGGTEKRMVDGWLTEAEKELKK